MIRQRYSVATKTVLPIFFSYKIVTLQGDEAKISSKFSSPKKEN